MNGYALGVFAVCLIGGVLTLLSHGSGRAERVVIGIITLYIIIAPVAEELADFDAEDLLLSLRGESIRVESEYDGVLEDAFADGVARAVAEKFSLNKDNIRVRLRGFDVKELRAERIGIILSGAAAFADYKAVEKYVNSLELGECDVKIEIG